jgi:hypothetical protein
MNNINIIQLEHFDIDNLKNILTLENPLYQGNTNYFSKLVFKENKKNVYFQLPKTKSKQGLVINGTKKYIEFIYTKNDKYIFSFIENLESFLIEEILKNKDMWFYNSESITYDDIENIIMPITKSYKNGNNVLLKTYFNLNKLVIYNENKEIIENDKFNANDYIIPLINVNGIKFSNKNFIIDINLLQLLVISDEEDLTNSLLINISDKNNSKNEINNDLDKEIKNDLDKDINNDLDKEIKNDLDKEIKNDLDKQVKNDLDKEITNDLDEEINNDLDEEINNDLDEEINNDLDEEINNDLDKEINNDLDKEINNECSDIIDITNNIINSENDNSFINIKSRENIYLQMYEHAIKKALLLKKNAIETFLKAKKIKNEYDLDDLIINNNIDDLNSFENFK